ncbi:MAG: cysteine--tRNA ligase, partial [Bacteroidia bacterium]|nr:cysteine--tRNA ligase [Methylotenera sp.]
LRAHYRSPLNYSDKHLDDAKSALTRLYTALRGFEVVDSPVDWQQPQAARFKAAMDDDFNTSEAMAVLFDLVKTKSLESASLLKSLGGVLGLLQRHPTEFLQSDVTIQLKGVEAKGEVGMVGTSTSNSEVIGHLTFLVTDSEGKSQSVDDWIIVRTLAKKAKNFAESDRIRKELADAGIILEDSPQGTTWRRA